MTISAERAHRFGWEKGTIEFVELEKKNRFGWEKGTIEFVDEYVLRDWDESKHPREPAGSPEGGQFGEGGGGAAPAAAPAPAPLAPLSKEQKRSVNYYQGQTGYHTINHALRHSKELKPQVEAHVKMLDDVINRFRASQPFNVYRGVKYDMVEELEKQWKEWQKDKSKPPPIFTDKAYLSTSFRKEAAAVYNPNNIITIKLPKGQHVFDVASQHMGHEGESEILLPRGMKFKVISLKDVQHGNGTAITVEPVT